MQRITLHTSSPNRRDLERVAKEVKNGALVIFPTDTTYALGCTMSNKSSIDRVLKISGKKEKKAKLSLICHDIKSISEFTLPYSNHTFKSMKRYLPGPYTFILNADNSVTKFFKNNKREIGIRIPDNEILLTFLKFLDEPLISTTMNMNEKVYTDPEKIEEDFQYDVEFLLDGGEGKMDQSTVLDCTDTEISIIRQGVGIVD